MEGIRHFFRAFRYSLLGLRAALRHEIAFQQEVALTVVLVPLALWLGKTPLEQAMLIAVLFLVLIVELINSAIEATVDRVSDERHPLSGRAKDVGSAAVFLAITNAIVVWAILLGTPQSLSGT